MRWKKTGIMPSLAEIEQVDPELEQDVYWLDALIEAQRPEDVRAP